MMTKVCFFFIGTNLNVRGSCKLQGICPEMYMAQFLCFQFSLVLGVSDDIKRSKNPIAKRFGIMVDEVTSHKRHSGEKLANPYCFLISMVIGAIIESWTTNFDLQWHDACREQLLILLLMMSDIYFTYLLVVCALVTDLVDFQISH